MRWVLGADADGAVDAAALEAAVGLKSILDAQHGATTDLDLVADALYGRSGA